MKTFFFFEITWFWTEKPTQSDHRSIKIRVKIVWCFSGLQNSPPTQIPDYAPVENAKKIILFLFEQIEPFENDFQ